MSQLVNLLPLVGIALIFWLLLIRPAQRQRKEAGRLQAALAVGDEVILTSGVYGTVRDLGDDFISIEVSPGVQIKVARAAVGAIVSSMTALGEVTTFGDPAALDDPSELDDPAAPERSDGER